MRSTMASVTKFLIWCGILSSLWYVLINVYVPLLYHGYSMASLTVSELSAIDAPTRPLWVAVVIPYMVLFMAFGIGVRMAAGTSRPLRALGTVIILYSIFNSYWPPMHMRGMEPTLTDTLHIVWAMITVLLMIVIMVLGATALGRKFRIYTILSILTHILFGVLTSLQAPNIPTNGPTPTIGIWERINISVFMLWIVVLAALLLRKLTPRTANKA